MRPALRSGRLSPPTMADDARACSAIWTSAGRRDGLFDRHAHHGVLTQHPERVRSAHLGGFDAVVVEQRGLPEGVREHSRHRWPTWPTRQAAACARSPPGLTTGVRSRPASGSGDVARRAAAISPGADYDRPARTSSPARRSSRSPGSAAVSVRTARPHARGRQGLQGSRAEDFSGGGGNSSRPSTFAARATRWSQGDIDSRRFCCCTAAGSAPAPGADRKVIAKLAASLTRIDQVRGPRRQ